MLKYLLPLVCLWLMASTQAQNYKTELIQVQPYAPLIERTGKLSFKRTSGLAFKSVGYLTDITVEEGEWFAQGDLLATLDTAELMADKNAKYSQLLHAKRELNRVKSLLAQNLGSEQQLDAAQTQVDISRSAYRVVYYNLEKAQIVAPFDGVVIQRSGELGELQSPGVNVLEVAAIEHNWVVKVALTEAEVQQIVIDQKVDLWLSQQKIQGRISKIPVSAELSSGLFIIEVMLPPLSRQTRLIAGQMVKVAISSLMTSQVYSLPISALIGMDEHQRAKVMIEEEAGELVVRTFEVFQMTNQQLLLRASPEFSTITAVVEGWQQMRGQF